MHWIDFAWRRAGRVRIYESIEYDNGRIVAHRKRGGWSIRYDQQRLEETRYAPPRRLRLLDRCRLWLIRRLCDD